MKESIIGNRVILREQRDEDADFYTYWYNKPEIMFQCGFDTPTTKEDVLNGIRKPSADSDWYTATDSSGRIVGETGLLRIWPRWRCTTVLLFGC